jgi:hypothetical protein
MSAVGEFPPLGTAKDNTRDNVAMKGRRAREYYKNEETFYEFVVIVRAQITVNRCVLYPKAIAHTNRKQANHTFMCLWEIWLSMGDLVV